MSNGKTIGLAIYLGILGVLAVYAFERYATFGEDLSALDARVLVLEGPEMTINTE